MQVRLTVPSKTFVIGEYAVLKGGPALVVATEPRFEALISTPGDGRLENIHRNSPAGLWARWNKETFQHIDFQFLDPHEGRGGFGASSAQFLLTWIWNQMESTPFSKLSEGVDVEQVLKDYLSLFEDSDTKPSGADVVAQSVGGLTQLKMHPLTVNPQIWPFEALDFLVVPTGNKIATHEHLAQVGASGFDSLSDISAAVCSALANKNSNGFLSGVNAYAKELESQRKTAEPTIDILNHWMTIDGVKAAKGCGALGADSFILFVDKSHSLQIRNQLKDQGLPVLASSLSLSSGLAMQLDIQGEVKQVSIKAPSGLIK